ncbi:MAG: hypothetical protein HOY71_41980, partial [Nonomuraea sp.]|nr:hypothetical protein [Nonomuraea sp.]
QAVHFGPGVSSEEPHLGTTAERIWREGRVPAAGRTAGGRQAKAARARRRRTILAAAVFALVMAGALVAWLKLGGGPALAVSAVNATVPKKTYGCDSVVTVTGTITTNGGAGEITYEWRKNLDKEVVKQTLKASAQQTTYTVPLRWTLKGKSTVKAAATLVITSPGKQITDKATFTYKC